MSPEILTSTQVVESTIVDAPLWRVWDLVKLENFSKFYSGIGKSECIQPCCDGADVIRWTFHDGMVIEVKREEYSVSLCRDTLPINNLRSQAIEHQLAFSIISCQPYKLPYSSVLSTISLYAITSGFAQNSTFVEWSGHYSSDAGAGRPL